MKHTPGPWAIGRDDRPGMEWNNHIVQRLNPNIAVCFMTHSGSDDNSEAESNATLISAAPDLLAAITRLANAAFARDTTMGDQCGLFAAQAELRDATLVARAAIAKATGGAT